MLRSAVTKRLALSSSFCTGGFHTVDHHCFICIVLHCNVAGLVYHNNIPQVVHFTASFFFSSCDRTTENHSRVNTKKRKEERFPVVPFRPPQRPIRHHTRLQRCLRPQRTGPADVPVCINVYVCMYDIWYASKGWVSVGVQLCGRSVCLCPAKASDQKKSRYKEGGRAGYLLLVS